MTHRAATALASLALALAALAPQVGEAALNAYLSRTLAPIKPEADQIVLFIGVDEIVGTPAGKRDGVIAVSHEAVESQIISPRDPTSAKGAAPRLAKPKVYSIVVNQAELKKAGLTKESLAKARAAQITLGGPAPGKADRIVLSIDLR